MHSPHNIVPVILSGGSGTRLWPLSRQAYPKQFLKLLGEHTMLQQTALRCQTFGAPVIVCNEDHRFIVAEQLRQIGITPRAIILEPSAKNTMAATLLAARYVQNQDPSASLLVTPADHFLEDTQAFVQTVEKAHDDNQAQRLFTFGVTPTYPETGYGYIKPTVSGEAITNVAEFVEKPDADTAKDYVAKGYLWNSGIFLMPLTTLMEDTEILEPALWSGSCEAMDNALQDLDFLRPNSEAFNAVRSVSIDYALMERTKVASVAQLDMPWSDVGNFDSLWQQLPKDVQNNSTRGDVIAINSHDNLLFAENQLVTTLGVDNLAVIATKDAVLVANKDAVQQVKAIVEQLTRQQRPEQQLHREVHRPWGVFDSVDRGDSYQVKHIRVKPGQQLSLQRHRYRAEHWVVVNGIADVTIENEQRQVKANESVYIPIGSKHRLANNQSTDLDIIEVQTGSYLGEDDIERFDDHYGRQ